MNLEDKLKELNIEKVPAYEEWLGKFLAIANNREGNSIFFSLLKKHRYDRICTLKYNNMLDVEKTLMYKKFYKEFLKTHLGITK